MEEGDVLEGNSSVKKCMEAVGSSGRLYRAESHLPFVPVKATVLPSSAGSFEMGQREWRTWQSEGVRLLLPGRDLVKFGWDTVEDYDKKIY